MSWFGSGYENVEKRDAEIQEAMKGRLPNLIIKDTDDDVYVSILNAEPITFYEHFLPAKKRSYTCPDNGDASKGTCPMCAMGNKPSFRGAYLVIDHRHEKWTDKRDGKQMERQHTLKVAKFGIRVLKSLKKMNERLQKGAPGVDPNPAGITGVPFNVIRSGTGTDTQYTFNPLQPNEQYFPRQYQLEDGKDERQTLIDNIEPLSREKLMEAIGGGSAPQQQYGQPANFGAPATPPQGYGQPQGNFGGQPPVAPPQQGFAPQGQFGPPQGQPNGAPQPTGMFGQATQQPGQATAGFGMPPEDDDVINFND